MILRQRMVRKQTYIHPYQDRALKRLAARLKSTEAEIIREALGQYLNSNEIKHDESAMFGFVNLGSGVPQKGSTDHDKDIYGT